MALSKMRQASRKMLVWLSRERFKRKGVEVKAERIFTMIIAIKRIFSRTPARISTKVSAQMTSCLRPTPKVKYSLL